MFERDKNWSGYSYDELQFRKLLNETQLELEKHKLLNDIQAIYNGNGKLRTAYNGFSNVMNYFDYALMAFRVGKRLLRFFKKN